jgi:hypothetical protein
MMRLVKKIGLAIVLLIISGFGSMVLLFSLYNELNHAGKEMEERSTVQLARDWAIFSGNRQGKVVFARPPGMIILDLTTGIEREVPGVVTAGAPGRKRRGKTPRPSWAPDGERFVYRYDNNVYVCDEKGNKQIIAHPLMDCSGETRWSWHRDNDTGDDWLVGPSIEKNVIMVKVSRPSMIKTAYSGGDVEKHCEITGTGKFVVYDNGSDIYVTALGSSDRGKKISSGQSCRPCAAPDDRAAWLKVPHTSYKMYDAASGKFIKDIQAPGEEEMYRLNWSNHPVFAVHMYGSGGDTRMNVRNIDTGGYLFIGRGWDPDLWMERNR